MSLKLIDPINGISVQTQKKRPIQTNELKAMTPTDSQDIHSDSESKIMRCNERIVKFESHSNSSSSQRPIENKIINTINVGSDLGFNMEGTEKDLEVLITSQGDYNVNP